MKDKEQKMDEFSDFMDGDKDYVIMERSEEQIDTFLRHWAARHGFIIKSEIRHDN